MSSSSIRLRLATGAIIAIAVALALSWFGLVALFERHVERRVGSELNLHLAQLAAHTNVVVPGQLGLDTEPADPRFQRVYSGLYWQIEDEASGALLRSRSLWDRRLDMPVDTPPIGKLDVHDIRGPRDEAMRAHERRLILGGANSKRTIRFAAAIDRTEIEVLVADFGNDALLALAGLGAVLIAASFLQIVLGLAPLDGIKHEVSAVRTGSQRRLSTNAAVEVKPLVDEVNALLDTVEEQVARARERAADLAHTLKTPLSALTADAERLAAKGEVEVSAQIRETVETMNAHVERELTRIRVHAGRTLSTTRFAPVAERVASVVRRVPNAQAIDIRVAAEANEMVPVEANDLTEILGNLIENAARYAKSEICVGVERQASGCQLVFVDDDGSGLNDEQRTRVIQRSERLDARSGGAGLGLAIVGDILASYGTKLDLQAAPIGGLRASFLLREAI